MMYIYDGSFDSLLNALCAALSDSESVEDIVTEAAVSELLFADTFYAGSDKAIASAFSKRIESISKVLLASICMAYLSEIKNFEIQIFNLCFDVFKNGVKVIDNPANKHTINMERTVRKVMKERHLMQGLIRFSELRDKTYYAVYEPDHNITGLLAPHFTDRMHYNWIIHDLKRGIAAINSDGNCEVVPVKQELKLQFTESEIHFRKLWQRYYKEIAIPERKNLKCQSRFMPKRYWKYLTEKQI